MNATSWLVAPSTEDKADVQPGALPVTFWEPLEYRAGYQMVGNFYDFVATLQFYNEGLGMWQNLDEDSIRFTTD